MKYVRNSGRKKESKQLTISDQKSVGDKLIEDARWIEELAKHDRFSFEWVHEVLLEILFQCMGKKEIVTGWQGEEKIARVFREKPALEIVGMIAKMNGHLFDTVKGQINKTVNGAVEHDHKHTIELEPDANRTAQVFNILEGCGALQPETKQIDITPVESVHSS